MSTATRRGAALGAATALAAATLLAAAPPALADDLDQTSAETLAAIEAQSWPEYTLGDFDIDVYAAKMLLDQGEIYPGELDLEFDQDLHDALVSYQDAFGLPAYGDLDTATWEHMRDLVFGQHQFRRGDTGPVVVMIQRQLNAKFNYHLATDGVYGYWTEQAVRDAQGHFGIGVDGVFGPVSFQALISYQDYDR
ncbi:MULTISPECIES: peptidoglycan-binding domain-containing protein [unclassified Nocardiopsis]|uniref:peptidoglycan-binding domain-containing protein n=1 Tax=unclassified Nocardiopsis TaxID=2649073 RepID=UPI00135CBE49|nr:MULTISPECIES: peptidoglycan-binding domain-containing protein [unclassified Nocardiopsis]